MATIHKEILIDATPEALWDAVRDVGALHTRLVPGFVTDVVMKPNADPPVRVVTFASGVVLEEAIVDVDDAARRLVWAIRAEGVVHHNGALQVSDAGPGRARAVRVADVLPHALAAVYGPLMAEGLRSMKQQME